MPSGLFKFSSDCSMVRFMSSNSPSTDAMNVLSKWRDMKPGRDFETIEDTDDHLVAKLIFADNDDSAGPHLQQFGSQFGVDLSSCRPANTRD